MEIQIEEEWHRETKIKYPSVIIHYIPYMYYFHLPTKAAYLHRHQLQLVYLILITRI